MSTFALEKLEGVEGRQRFEKLVVDGVAPFDVFEQNVASAYKSELIGIYAVMNDVANLKSVPQTKFHPYSDGKDGLREFEFKSKHLRVYAVEQKGGKIIIIGGTKATQKKDEAEFRRLKNLLNKQFKIV
ncbi:MAG: hypothetical protein II939_16115 [Bacteroidales bacterium]|nr:hypothetical protein [Bacteroidales bacterium]